MRPLDAIVSTNESAAKDPAQAVQWSPQAPECASCGYAWNSTKPMGGQGHVRVRRPSPAEAKALHPSSSDVCTDCAASDLEERLMAAQEARGKQSG